MSPLLQVRDLTVALPGEAGPLDVLHGVDLGVDSGESFGLIGESGSGKSMTALAILGLLPEWAEVTGTIRFMGENLLAMPPAERRRLRGRAMVFQEPLTALNPVMTIGDQVAEGLRHRGVARKAALDDAAGALARVGLDPGRFPLKLYPHQLSGGQRQRVMIAMCLAMRPKLLIADEPTTALDVTVQAEILALLQDAAEQEGMALLLITHDLGVIAAMTTRMAVVYAGRVVETGRTADVFEATRHPYTRALFDALPSLEPGRRPVPIPGNVPSPFARPNGCAFAPRCLKARARCRAEVPPLIGDHPAACFYPEGLG